MKDQECRDELARFIKLVKEAKSLKEIQFALGFRRVISESRHPDWRNYD